MTNKYKTAYIAKNQLVLGLGRDLSRYNKICEDLNVSLYILLKSELDYVNVGLSMECIDEIFKIHCYGNQNIKHQIERSIDKKIQNTKTPEKLERLRHTKHKILFNLGLLK